MTELDVYPLRQGYLEQAPPEVVEAVRGFIGDWDGLNWQALRQALREHGIPDEELDSLTMMSVRMRCLFAKPKIVLHLGGTIATHTGVVTSLGDAKRKPAPKLNAKGDQAEKLVAYLTRHHQYENGIVGNYHPAESADIVRESGARKSSTVSDFLRREFPCSGKPRDGYIRACKGKAALLHWFMVKHGDSLPNRNADLGGYDESTIREKW